MVSSRSKGRDGRFSDGRIGHRVHLLRAMQQPLPDLVGIEPDVADEMIPKGLEPLQLIPQMPPLGMSDPGLADVPQMGNEHIPQDEMDHV
jgi:hypothetical protein